MYNNIHVLVTICTLRLINSLRTIMGIKSMGFMCSLPLGPSTLWDAVFSELMTDGRDSLEFFWVFMIWTRTLTFWRIFDMSVF